MKAGTNAKDAQASVEKMTGGMRKELRWRISQIAKMDPHARWDHFEEKKARGLKDWAVVSDVWIAITCTVADFKGSIERLPNWTFETLREFIVKPPGNGVMSVTKLRALDARMRRSAEPVKPAIGRAGL